MSNDDDQSLIRDLLGRYAACIDLCDFNGVGACFAPNATAIYSGRRFEGRQSIVDQLSRVAGFARSTHLLGNGLIEVDGRSAASFTSGVIYLIDGAAETQDGAPARVRMRGVSYADKFEKDVTWHISERHHRLLWSVTLEGALPSPSAPPVQPNDF